MSDLMSENSFSASDNFSENSIDRRVSFRDTVEGKISLGVSSYYNSSSSFQNFVPGFWEKISDTSFKEFKIMTRWLSRSVFPQKFWQTFLVTSAVDYERRSKQKWMKLSTMDKMQIRLELNKYKMAEMTVHPESVKHNQYYEFPTEITQPMKRHVFQPKLRIVRIGAIRWRMRTET